MSRITVCPQCQTRFRVTDEQLLVRDGNVRCGRCAHVFNALESRLEASPPPSVETAGPVQPDAAGQDQEYLPIQEAFVTPEPEALQEAPLPPEIRPANETPYPPIGSPETPAEADLPAEFLPGTPPDDEPAAIETVSEHAFDAPSKPPSSCLEPEPEPEPEDSAETESRVVRIQLPSSVVQPKVSPASPKYAPLPKPGRAWPWALASLLLLTGLAGQGVYFFRDAIAAHYPLTRSLLEQACGHLQCRVSLPRNPDLISIESSELHADPARANIVVLTSILRNRASHVQAYPTLELTLTNTSDQMVARKLFTPAEYLRKTAPISQGIPTGGEVAVKLLMDLGDLKAEGYRLYLFYPPQL